MITPKSRLNNLRSGTWQSTDTVHASKIVVFLFSATILGKNRSISSCWELFCGLIGGYRSFLLDLDRHAPLLFWVADSTLVGRNWKFLRGKLEILTWEKNFSYRGKENFFGLFISFLRSFISSLRGEYFFLTWRFGICHVEIDSYSRCAPSDTLVRSSTKSRTFCTFVAEPAQLKTVQT